MPMHPECRQQHLHRLNFNQAMTIFLPVTAMSAKQRYLKEYYEEQLEAEQAEAREREYQADALQWYSRLEQAQAEGRPFHEPLPDYRKEPSPPMPWWEDNLGAFLVWLDDLPGGKYITIALIILLLPIILPIFLPWMCYSVQRDWNRMLRRDRDYRGDANCDLCGDPCARREPAGDFPSG